MKQGATFDTSFWANAFRAGLLPRLRDRFALHYAPQVGVELRETNPGGRAFWRLARAGEVVEVAPATLHLHEYGAGERAAISLAIEHPEWALLIDDRRPFLAARQLGLTVICSPLLIVMLTGEQALLDEEAETLLQRLAGFNTVSPYLISEARLMLRRLSGATETER